MGKMIQIRNVPEPLHRKLKARAATEGLSLSDYLLRQVELMAALPSLAEWLDRQASLPPVVTSISSTEVIRAERDRR